PIKHIGMLRFLPILLAILINNTFGQSFTDELRGIGTKAADEEFSITIVVKDIRNTKGVLRFKFFNDSLPFPDENGFLKKVVPKSEMAGDSVVVTFTGFKSQFMGIALQDDENNDRKLDFGFFLPKE